MHPGTAASREVIDSDGHEAGCPTQLEWNPTMKIDGQTIKRGAITRGYIETSGYAMGIRLKLPFIAAAGTKPGKMLAITALQHGRELNGPAAVHRFFQNVKPAELRGTILAFPVVHPVPVYAHVQDWPLEVTRGLRNFPPHEPLNVNRNWPGNAAGNYHERITAAVWKYIRRADCVIDQHGWSERVIGLTWGQKYCAAYVRAYGFPWSTIHRNVAAQGMLEGACSREKIPYVINETTPQNKVEPTAVQHILRGIRNIAKKLEILQGDLEFPPHSFELAGIDNITVEAEHHGLAVSDLYPGAVVEKGDRIVEVVDLDKFRAVQTFRAPRRMILQSVGCCWATGMNNFDVVQPGNVIARLSTIGREYVNGKRRINTP